MKSLLRLRVFLQPYRGPFALSILLLLLLTGLGLVVPAIIQQVIDIGLARREIGYLVRAAGWIAALGVARALLAYANRYLGEWLASHIGYDIRNRLYDHIQHLSFSYHDHTQTGQLISRCIEDARAIERFAGSGLAELLRVILLIIGITILVLLTNPRLAIFALIPLLPLLWISFRFGGRIGKFFYAVNHALGDLSTRLQENVSGVQVVRAFAREPYEMDRFAQANRVLFDASVKVNAEWSKIMPTSNLLVAFCTILILWFGGPMVVEGTITIGELVAFNSYVIMLAGPAGQLTWLVNGAGEAVAGAQRTFEVLDTLPEICNPVAAEAAQVALSGQVEFEHVYFAYQGENAQALSDIHVQIKPNQVVALIGPTGSGKTSLINLIPRFYDASEGAVRLDGVDVRQMDLTSLRQQIGIVLQTSLLFSASVRDNIAFGRPDASLDEVIEAAKAAQAHEFIQELPQSYETVVGERGVTLSGGQRQRVAIARALLMNPRILILDDSTSSVDTQTERLIQRALNRLMEGRTTLIIAHRLSTVRRADQILVLDGGRIVQRGAHEQLLAQNGLYREIYDLQLRDQEQLQEPVETQAREPVAVVSNVGAGMKKE